MMKGLRALGSPFQPIALRATLSKLVYFGSGKKHLTEVETGTKKEMRLGYCNIRSN